MLSTLVFLESLRAISTQVCGRPSIAIQLSLTRVWSCLFLVSDDAYAVMEPPALLLSPQLSPSSSFASLLNVFSTVFLLLFLIPCATPFCPLACECNEEVLSVSCAASQLEVESSQNQTPKKRLRCCRSPWTLASSVCSCNGTISGRSTPLLAFMLNYSKF